MKIKEGDLITEGGISYVVEKDEDGTLWGVSNNAEYEIEIDENFCPDALFSSWQTPFNMLAYKHDQK